MEFRSRIKELCEERGITQKELAERLGITDISLNKTLRGGYPQLQTLEKIANQLEVEVWQLFTRPIPSSDFIAFIRKGGQTYTFESEEALRQFLG